MKLENGKISNSQLTVLIFSFLQGAAITVSFIFPLTKQGSWLAFLAGFVVSILIFFIYTVIAQRFPGQNLVQINDIVFGRYLGKLISFLYLWFFFQLIVHNTYLLNSFWITYIMPETPRAAFILMFTLVCAMAVWKGLEVIARCSFLFAVTAVFTTVVITVLLIGDMKPANLLPVIDFSAGEFFQSTFIVVTICFCEILAFLMIIPYTADKRRIRKPVMLGLFLSAIQVIIVIFRGILVMGPRVLNTTSVPFASSRIIDIAEILTRLDILVAIGQLITIFMKVTIFYYVFVLSTAQILKLPSYKHLIVPIGALSAAFAAILYESDLEQAYSGTHTWPFYAAIYQIALPVITLIVIALRKLPSKNNKTSLTV
ncbi:hypothetical protein SDC9_54655 [bioreactor metagenome]|uniref:Spore germination protein YndE n=1 Tax=bioreactor metagenome TaxID=1076179 RepID=A0A644X228_9ZZZZ